MAPPTGAWRFGTYEERETGGIPGIIFWDIVFPWTIPPIGERPEWWPLPIEEEGGWWVEVDPQDLPDTQGWERNLDVGGTGHPNFPLEGANPYVDIVMVAVRSLKNHEDSPPRRDRGTGAEAVAEANEWPYTMADGVKRFFEVFYEPNYINSLTRIIPWCSERDVRHAFEEPPDLDPPPWDQADGRAALEEMVDWFLEKFGDRVAGWGMIDEPEQGGDRLKYTGPTQMEGLRSLLRERERAWRIEHETETEPPFAELTEAQQNLRLRPTILNFSRRIVYVEGGDNATVWSPDNPWNPETPTARPATPEDYRNSADVFMYDEYPYKATEAQLQQWVNDTKIEQEVLDRTVENGLLLEPIQRALEGYRSLWRRLNLIDGTEDTREFSDPFYRPVAAFIQAQGYPYHENGSDEGSWITSPTEEPDPEAMLKAYPFIPDGPAIGPILGLPTARQLRFYAWATLFLGGEGLPCFSLVGLSSWHVWNQFRPVFKEVRYFAALRYNFHNRFRVLESRSYGPVTEDDPSGRGLGLIRSMAVVFDYPVPPTGIPETYLVLMNPRDDVRTVALTFDPPLEMIGTVRQRFVPWRSDADEDEGEIDDDPVGITPVGPFDVDTPPALFTMQPNTFVLYRLLPVP